MGSSDTRIADVVCIREEHMKTTHNDNGAVQYGEGSENEREHKNSMQ